MRHIQLYSLVDRRNRRENRRSQSLRRRLARFGLGCAAAGLVGFFALVLAASLAYTQLVSDLPSLSLLPDQLDPQGGDLSQPTRLYDRSGQHLLMTLENPGISRVYLPIDPHDENSISADLVRAAWGVMDPGFWNMPGFSVRHLFNPQPETIPERLVDDLILWQEPAGFRRTFRMRILAAQLVARYGHEQVLEWYLNSASFGHLTFGAESAAQLYLGKSAADVNLAEAALLAAALQAPALNPWDAPQSALGHQQEVLDDLLKQGTISAQEHRQASAEELQLAAQADSDPAPASAFSRLALEGLADRFGRARLERGGLRIITTLDYDLQVELACLARTQLSRLSGQPQEFLLPDGSPCGSVQLLPSLPPGDQPVPETLLTSAVILDPNTGELLALLGDTSVQGETPWLASRAPGSLLTPFVALTGFTRGMGPASLTWDIPSSLPEELASRANPDGQYHGPVRLRMAVANDYLAPLAQLLVQIGAENVWRTASAVGLSNLAAEGTPALLYGGGSVSPVEMAQAYGVIAAQGLRAGQRQGMSGDIEPATILLVEDLNGVSWLDARQPESQTVISSQLAYLVHHVLSDATARWPSLGYPNPLEIGRPSGAKIGRVEGGEVWAAGYSPQRVAVFWLGLPQNAAAETQIGPRMVAGMWHALMQFMGRDLPVQDWAEPEGISHVEVCDPSGQLPTAACQDVVSEVFLNGSEPFAPDGLYRAFQINRETGRLATIFTPPVLVEEKIFLVVPPQAADWARSAGLPVPPEDYDAIQPGDPSPDLRIDQPAPFAFVSGEVALKGTAAGSGFRFYQIQVGQGLNPQTWLQVGADGNEPVEDDLLAVWDTQGQEGLYAIRLQVVRSDQRVETSTVQVTVDNTAPLVRIPYPISGQTYPWQQNRAIIFQAEADDAIGISRIVWLVDGKAAGETFQTPYVINWKPERGKHRLEVRAYDLAGNEGRSETVEFEVGAQ